MMNMSDKRVCVCVGGGDCEGGVKMQDVSKVRGSYNHTRMA